MPASPSGPDPRFKELGYSRQRYQRHHSDKMSRIVEEDPILEGRFYKWLQDVDNPNSTPLAVYPPLAADKIKDLDIIRELSQQLQSKKDEDDRKAADGIVEPPKAVAPKEAEDEEEDALVKAALAAQTNTKALMNNDAIPVKKGTEYDALFTPYA